MNEKYSDQNRKGLFKGTALDYIRMRADKHEKVYNLPKQAEHLRKLADEAEMKWQPINTAPLDRTLILVRGSITCSTYKILIISAYYDTELRALSPWLNTYLDSYGFVPTEWMPLSE